VIISGPAGAFAAWGDAEYAKHIAGTGGTVPPWLAEHMQHGIPTLADLLAAVVTAGHSFSVHVNEGVIQHYSGLFADNYPFMNRFLSTPGREVPGGRPVCAAEGDVPYSYLFAIDDLGCTTIFHRLEGRSSSEPRPGHARARTRRHFRRRPSSRQNAGDTGYSKDLGGRRQSHTRSGS
jgi:hypothetical protein